jgi:fatty-acyl-CoA synthase
VPHLEHADLEKLRVIIDERLADYRRPKWLVAHGGELPRTLSGKILKRELKSAYAEVPPGAVALKLPSPVSGW